MMLLPQISTETRCPRTVQIRTVKLPITAPHEVDGDKIELRWKTSERENYLDRHPKRLNI